LPATASHATAALAEADRVMVVCNSCRYCEGLCAVFPAMELRRTFADGDLNYLANLCHDCGACYDACQFSPPHEFDINVPRALAKVRNDSYGAYAWPRMLSGLFERNGLAVAVIAALSVTLFVLGCVAFRDPSVVWGRHTGPGAFYRLIPHETMIFLFGSVFIYALVALGMGAAKLWRDIREPFARLARTGSLWSALIDAGRLRYLDGGRGGCDTEEQRLPDTRKVYHHFTFYGFVLCFASTCVATVYHYVLGWQAPYAWYDVPVVLGTVGGIGLLVGPTGLLLNKLRRPSLLADKSRTGFDIAFLSMLFLTSLTGLALLLLRETAAMGVLLALHLGVVFALFATMPYGKFVHGIYRYVALVRYSQERKRFESTDATAVLQ
jgi:citrate/tricarballylate utilization protein